jgi:hypothetical protein
MSANCVPPNHAADCEVWGFEAGRRQERARIREVLDRSKIEWMIHAFDLIDELMVRKGLPTSSEVQDDLRRLADLLDAP